MSHFQDPEINQPGFHGSSQGLNIEQVFDSTPHHGKLMMSCLFHQWILQIPPNYFMKNTWISCLKCLFK